MQVAKDATLNQPQLTVVTSTVNFDAIDLTIHSRAADWLYQAVMSLFRGTRAKEQHLGACSMHQSCFTPRRATPRLRVQRSERA